MKLCWAGSGCRQYSNVSQSYERQTDSISLPCNKAKQLGEQDLPRDASLSCAHVPLLLAWFRNWYHDANAVHLLPVCCTALYCDTAENILSSYHHCRFWHSLAYAACLKAVAWLQDAAQMPSSYSIMMPDEDIF